MGICDWFKRENTSVWLYRIGMAEYNPNEALKPWADSYDETPKPAVECDIRIKEAHRKACEAQTKIWDDFQIEKDKINGFRQAPVETVESVLNQFIALGYDKPEVVISGEKRQDGFERYTAKIDGEFIFYSHLPNIPMVFSCPKDAEDAVLSRIKNSYSQIIVETIEITY